MSVDASPKKAPSEGTRARVIHKGWNVGASEGNRKNNYDEIVCNVSDFFPTHNSTSDLVTVTAGGLDVAMEYGKTRNQMQTLKASKPCGVGRSCCHCFLQATKKRWQIHIP